MAEYHEDNGCDTSRNVLVAVTVVACCLGWVFLSENIDSAQAQLWRVNVPGKDLLVDAVRKTQDMHKTFLSAIKNISNTVVFDGISSKFTKSCVIK